MNARYQSGKWGRFLSQDSVFQAMGNEGKIDELTQQRQREILADPQLLNSYSYARNNPLAMKDESGNFAQAIVAAPFALNPVGLAIGAVTIATGVVFYKSGGLRNMGPIQIPNIGWPSVPSGPEDMIPHLKGPNGPDWKTVVGVGTVIISTAVEIYNESKNLLESLDKFGSDIRDGSTQNSSIPSIKDTKYYIGPTTQSKNSISGSTLETSRQTIKQTQVSSVPQTSNGGLLQSLTNGINAIFKNAGNMLSR